MIPNEEQLNAYKLVLCALGSPDKSDENEGKKPAPSEIKLRTQW